MAQSGQFFGRQRDIQDLYERIMLEKLVVVFGKSGYGKSSLLNAGILPKLMHPPAADKRFLPVVVRFTPYTAAASVSPVSILLDRLPATAKDPSPGTDTTLWHTFKACQQSGYHFVLLFDQFEEFFTYPLEQQVEFREQLAELLYTGIPQTVRDQWETLSEEEKKRFSETLDVHAVFAIREDRLSWLNSLREALPAILHQRYEIKGLTDEQAREAIIGPAALPQAPDFACPPFSYSTDALDTLLAELKKNAGNPGGSQPQHRIEAFLLQICCEDIERRMIERAGQGHPTTMVTKADLPRFERIYDDYYHHKTDELPAPQREAARRLIEEELVGLNEATGVVFRLNADGRKLAAQPGVTEELLKKLTDCFLLRAEPNSTGGFNYEITHDTLVPAVLQSKGQRLEQEKSRLEKQKLAEERRKRRLATGLAIGGFVLSALAITASIYAWQARNQAQIIAQANQLLSLALQTAGTDATRSLELVSQALTLLPNDKTALQARHDIYSGNEFYHRAIACDGVSNVVLSPDGSLILAAAGHQAILYDTAGNRLQVFENTGQRLHVSRDSTGAGQAPDTLSNRVYAIGFAPDGERLLTAAEDGIVRVWNTRGQLLWKLGNSNERITAAMFSPDGRFILAGRRNGTASLWSAGGGELIKTWAAHTDEITAVDFTGSGDTLLTASMDGRVHLWHTGQATSLVSLAHKTPVLTASLAPHGRQVITGERSGHLQLWQVSGKLAAIWPAHTRRINSARFAPNGAHILTCSDDRQIKYWDTTGRELKTYRGHTGFVYSLALRRDGAAFVSAAEDGTIKLWKVDSKIDRAFHIGESPLGLINWSPDGQFLLTAQGSGLQAAADLLNTGTAEEDAFWEALEQPAAPQAAHVWDHAGRLVHTLTGHQSAITALAHYPGDGGYVSGSDDGAILLWDTSGRRLQTWGGEQGSSILALAVSSAGQMAAASQTSDSVLTAKLHLWRNGQLLQQLRLSGGQISYLAFSPDGRRLLSGGYDDSLRVWQVQPGGLTPERSLAGSEGRIERVVWSPDGQYVAMGESGSNARLSVWDTNGKLAFTQTLPAENKTGGRGVTAVAFSPDGRLVAAGAEGGMVKIFNLSGQEIQTFEDLNGQGIQGLAFSPEARHLWVGSRDGWVRRIWILGH